MKHLGWVFSFMKFGMLTGLLLITVDAKANDASWSIAYCNNCTTFDMFRATARSQGVEKVVVVNLDSLQARAFHVTETESPKIPDLTVRFAYEVSVPQDVTTTLSELQNLKQAFQDVENAAGTSSSQAKQDFEIFSFQSTGGPNGCGTPDHWSYNLIPDYPFEAACNAHDICYGGSRTKESCDDEFLFRMRQIASNLKGSGIFATYFGERLLKGFVRQQATIYHHFVANNAAALTAYCNSTESNSSTMQL